MLKDVKRCLYIDQKCFHQKEIGKNEEISVSSFYGIVDFPDYLVNLENIMINNISDKNTSYLAVSYLPYLVVNGEILRVLSIINSDEEIEDFLVNSIVSVINNASLIYQEDLINLSNLTEEQKTSLFKKISPLWKQILISVINSDIFQDKNFYVFARKVIYDFWGELQDKELFEQYDFLKDIFQTTDKAPADYDNRYNLASFFNAFGYYYGDPIEEDNNA